MAGSAGTKSGRRGLTRWLPVPAAVALFALIGMAISTEDRSDFRNRESQVAALPDPGVTGATAPTVTAGGSSGASAPATTAPAPAPEANAPSSTTADDTDDGAGGGGAAVSFEISATNGRLGVDLGGPNPLARAVTADGTVQAPVELLDGPTGPATGVDPLAGTGSGPGGTGPDGTGPDGTGSGSATTVPGDPSTAPPGAGGSTDGTTTDGTTSGGTTTGGTVGGPGADGPTVGLRLGDDGRLEPVGRDGIAPGDLVVDPAGVGIDVLRADGTRIEVRPGPSLTDPVPQATEVSPDGTTRSLEPDAEGRIALGDGLTLTVPTPDEPADRSLSSVVKSVTSGPWRWVLLGLVALIGAGVLADVYRRRRRQPDEGEPFGPGWVGAAPIPAHRFEELLALLAADPDPGRAIRLAFSAAERGLGRLPRRLSTETPFEWYRRVAADHPDLAQHLAGLCGCYANARFAANTPSSPERDLAVAELRQLHRLSRERPGPGGGGGGGTDGAGGADPGRPAEVGAGV